MKSFFKRNPIQKKISEKTANVQKYQNRITKEFQQISSNLKKICELFLHLAKGQFSLDILRNNFAQITVLSLK